MKEIILLLMETEMSSSCMSQFLSFLILFLILLFPFPFNIAGISYISASPVIKESYRDFYIETNLINNSNFPKKLFMTEVPISLCFTWQDSYYIVMKMVVKNREKPPDLGLLLRPLNEMILSCTRLLRTSLVHDREEEEGEKGRRAVIFIDIVLLMSARNFIAVHVNAHVCICLSRSRIFDCIAYQLWTTREWCIDNTRTIL